MKQLETEIGDDDRSTCFHKGGRIFGIFIYGIIIATIFALAFGWLIMLLWNEVVPSLFHLSKVSYWQAVGLIILSRLLFGGFGGPHKHGHDTIHNHDLKRKFKKCFDGSYDSDHSNLFEDFWKEEGCKAFELYLERKKSDESVYRK